MKARHRKLLATADDARKEAVAAREILNTVIERVNDGFVALDSDWRYTYVNARAARMLQRETPDDLIGKHIWTEYPEGIGQPFHQAYLQAFETQQPVIFEEHYTPWDQWYENRIYPSPDGLTIYFTEITKRKQAEETLRQSATLFATTRDGVIITDLDTCILSVNPAFTEITGYTETEVLGQIPSMLQSGRGKKDFYQTLWSSLLKTGHWQGEIWNRRKNGEIYPEWLTITTVLDEKGKPSRYVGVFSDISHIKQSEAKFEHLAQHDALTQLPNRLLLFSRLQHSIEKAQRDHKLLALLMLALDHFKDVNDSFGHLAGDELLQQADTSLYKAKAEGRGRFKYFTEELTHSVRALCVRASGLKPVCAGQSIKANYACFISHNWILQVVTSSVPRRWYTGRIRQKA